MWGMFEQSKVWLACQNLHSLSYVILLLLEICTIPSNVEKGDSGFDMIVTLIARAR